jgi:hypothetical protein
MRRIKLILALASMAMLLVAFAAPAMAHNFNHHHFFNPFNNNGVFQSSEQDVESGDSSQTFNVTGGGDNSNSCQGIQGISNTGNAVTNTNVLQYASSGEVEVDDSGNFEIDPSQTTTCKSDVNQAASASGS